MATDATSTGGPPGPGRAPGPGGAPGPARLRRGRTVLAPVLVFALCLLPVALLSPWAALVLLLPVVLAVGLLRTGVDVGDAGLTVRSPVAARHVPWAEVAGIRVGPRSDLWLVTTRGTELRLPVLRAGDLPQLSRLSGGRIAVPVPPGEDATEGDPAAGQ